MTQIQTETVEEVINTGENQSTPAHTVVPHTLVRERILEEAQGRLMRVGEEFEGGFAVLEKYHRTVSIFGSARLPQDHPAALKAYEVAAHLARAGYAVATGGGNGIMEAANHGAYDAGGGSIGINIQLPMEQNLNPYTTDHFTFKHFFARKVLLTLGSHAYIYCPGGFGTLDELFEIITLMQTKKIPRAPIILMGDHFWKPLDSFIRHVLLEGFEVISPEDTQLYTITEDIDEIVHIIESHAPAES